MFGHGSRRSKCFQMVDAKSSGQIAERAVDQRAQGLRRPRRTQIDGERVARSGRSVEPTFDRWGIAVAADARPHVTVGRLREHLQMCDGNRGSGQKPVEAREQRADDGRRRERPLGAQLALPVQPAKRGLGFSVTSVIDFEQPRANRVLAREYLVEPLADARACARAERGGIYTRQRWKAFMEVRLTETHEIGFGDLLAEKIRDHGIRIWAQHFLRARGIHQDGEWRELEAVAIVALDWLQDGGRKVSTAPHWFRQNELRRTLVRKQLRR